MFSKKNRNHLARAVSAALAVFLLAGVGCKKHEDPPPPPPPQPVAVKLQVTSISPAVTAPNVAVTAKVFGSAFGSGATVHFAGATEVAGNEVRVLDSNTLSVVVPALAVGTYDVRVTNPGGEGSTLRQGLNVKVLELSCKSATVNFAFDDASLASAGRGTLDSGMSCYQAEAASIRIDGHTDSRGTVDYNLALGQRRADSVKKHLASGGVSGRKMTTHSYGEERPVASGSGDRAWSQNRRAEVSASP